MSTESSSHLSISLSEPGRGLSAILFSRAIQVTVLGLVFYSAIEMAIDPPTDVLNFVRHHFVHVVAIGIAVLCVCWWTLKENVLDPVSLISRHLYRMRSGRLEPLRLDTQANEMQEIVSGMNSLTERLRKAKTGGLDRALTNIQELRARLGKVALRDEEQKVPLMRCVSRLEAALLGLVSETKDQR